MSKVKNLYEAIVMFSLKQGQEAVELNVSKILELINANAQEESVNVDKWGKRRLAYEINKETEAYYVLFNFISDAEFPTELERICKITDGIIRSLVVKKES